MTGAGSRNLYSQSASSSSSSFPYGVSRPSDDLKPFSLPQPSSPPMRHSRLVKAVESPSNQHTDSDGEGKRRKVQRACDVCRRKKIKCEGPMNSSSKSSEHRARRLNSTSNLTECSNCQEYGYECTYVEAAKRRGPPKGYLDTLEQRCGRLEGVLQRLYPGFDYNAIVGPPMDRDAFDLGQYQEELRAAQIPAFPAIKPFSVPTSVSNSSPSDSPAPHILGPQPWKSFEQDPQRPIAPDGDHIVDRQQAIVQAINKLEVKDPPWRFHGKASAHHLIIILNEIRAKNEWMDGVQLRRRPAYWEVPEWEIIAANEGIFNIDYSAWPSPDLARLLIDAYFSHINPFFPLLNQVIFNKQYKSGLWESNPDFARVCLLVFATAARYVNDPRVYWDAEDSPTEDSKQRIKADEHGSLKFSAGWKWLRVLLKAGRNIMKSPKLFDFQVQVLLCVFLHGSTIAHLGWIVAGVGLRAAQELGIHVRSILQKSDPVERALYSRAFWCLYHIDRFNCAVVGRSVALQDSDFDADYPIAVDDEFWDTGDPRRDFIQPLEAGPSKIDAFIQRLKLDHIMGATLRTIYAVNKPSDYRTDPAGERAVVVQLDSALNSWADTVPDHLRWDPHRTDEVFFLQSALLYCYYYHCQILIHRTYIPTPKQAESIGLPSLAICCNASRAISNIMEVVTRRQKRSQRAKDKPTSAISVVFMLPTWTAAIVLLVSISSGKQHTEERERAKADVQKCIVALKELEKTWRQAGKLCDVLTEISTDMETMDSTPPPQGQKRAHETSKPTVDRPPTPEQIFGLFPTFSQGPSNYVPPTISDGSTIPLGDATGFGSLYDPITFDSYSAPTETFPTNLEDDLWSQLIAGYIHGTDTPAPTT